MLRMVFRFMVAGMIVILLVPLAAVCLSGSFGQWSGGVSFADKVDVPEKIEVWDSDSERVVEVDFEEYVACVVAGEMPAGFHEEALKAQAVAARTYAMAKVLRYGSGGPEEHPKAAVCSTTHCQVYRTEEEKEAVKAAESTAGELLYYDGELVSQPLFFSSSGGQTENSEDVFVSAVPYLVSVASPYEAEATHQNEETVMTIKELRAKLAAAFPEEAFGKVERSTIKVLSRTAGGRVERMQIGDVTLKGTQVRSALGLSSALFNISFREGSGWNGSSAAQTEIVFTSSGSGHGVGMSQYGADGMGKAGYTYKEILKHYYSGVEIY